MKRLNQFEMLTVDELETETYHQPIHPHHYFELIYIMSGEGKHHLNKAGQPYHSGDLLLICPDDEHHFDISRKTRFVSIKFTDGYFAGHQNLSATGPLRMSPQQLMLNKLVREIKLQFDEPGASVLRSTIQRILYYSHQNNIITSPFIYHQILSIFGLIKETISAMGISIDNGLPDKDRLVSYINHHIYKPDKLLIKNIADHFGIATSYFSSYFKRNFDLSYRDYVNNQRMMLIESRLTEGNFTLKEIAAEFGFTDEAHLSNYFKKRNKESPISFRKSTAALNPDA